jgi:hypothetical protein
MKLPFERFIFTFYAILWHSTKVNKSSEDTLWSTLEITLVA